MNILVKTTLISLFIFSTLPIQALNIQTFQATHHILSKTIDTDRNNFTEKSDCPKKKKYCKGNRTWNDGSTYEGEFKFGEPHGNGIYQWPDGAHYKGHFLDGYRHGKGTQRLENGDIFEGEWRFGLMHGYGTYSWVDGSKYEGEFYEGLMHGKGTIHLANGESYVGEWKDGLADGDGTFNRVDGSKYVGKSKEGERHGKGVITWRTGDVFMGTWKRGKAHKTGTFHYNNGDKYICIWEDGEMTGEATYISYNGKEIKGNLIAIERELQKDSEISEALSANLGITWYAIAMEYKTMKQYNLAAENLRIAQKYLSASSDLSKLIHQQLKIIDDQKEKIGL